jgi:uncharacterized protein
MRIIDSHVHLCQDPRREQLVFPKANWPLDWYWASPERAVSYMDARGISELVSVNIMDTARMIETRLATAALQGTEADGLAALSSELRSQMVDRVRAFNDWACHTHKQEPRILVFVMADPVLFGPAVVDEVQRCLENGATGVKLHPSICRHLPDHPDLLGLYELCQDREIPIITDSNGIDEPLGIGYGQPVHWRRILAAFPRLRLIMAHLCDGRWDERVALAEEFTSNLWFDMSGGMVDATHPRGHHNQLPLDEAPRIFRRIGTHRILFGSDEPAAGRDVLDYAWQILRMGLTDIEKEDILWRNAAALLGLPSQSSRTRA